MKNDIESIFTLINSRRFFIKSIFGYLIMGFDALLAGAVFSRGASRSFLSRIMDIPYGIEVALYFLVFILLGIAVSLVVNKEKNKGEIQFGMDQLYLAGKKLNLINTPITISLNAAKGKATYERTLKYGGGNNWVEFKQGKKTEKYEFLIPTLKQEQELVKLIEKYWSRNFRVEMKVSPPSFWEKLSF